MHMILYRGTLKSCNYRCSYCPFSKHGRTQRELARDREQWLSFISCFQEQAERCGIRALMLAPYGEALIHPWYWEGLAKVSALPWVDAAGAQTNLGFQAAEAMQMFAENGGIFTKLRLWATFHPEMTSVQAFVKNCRQLWKAGVRVSAGAVGVPEHTELLRQLRKELPKDIYLWINRMDGLGRSYTIKEIQVFSEIDPYFYRELQPHPADVSQCRGRYFAEGDGRLRLCNISSVLETGWEDKEGSIFLKKDACSRRRCSCYLAYGGRDNLENQMLFGPWPLFRIPRRPRAVFLDIGGTLLADTKKQPSRQRGRDISAEMQAALEVLVKREKTLLFFATTLPYEDARQRCRSIWHLFSGGIFAGGAHIFLNLTKAAVTDRKTAFVSGNVPDESAECLTGSDDPADHAAGLDRKKGQKVLREIFYDMDEEIVRYLEHFREKPYIRMLVYRNAEGRVYKITLLHARQRSWSRQEAEKVLAELPEPLRRQVRYVLEDYCMQMIAAEAGKAAGVRMLCEWLRIPLHEIFTAGDSEEDVEMLQLNEIDFNNMYK